MFGCCSLNVECSDNGSCLRKGTPDYQECYYRRNLEAGKIFYGKNAFQSIKVPAAEVNEIFLFSDKRLFRICRKDKNGSSYRPNKEQVAKLVSAFKDLSIPFKTEMEEEFCSIETPSNSRVYFELDEDKYHILNFNSWLIHSTYADRISAALIRKGIIARTEMFGSYTQSYVPVVYKPKAEVKQETKKPDYEQVSVFDLAI